MKLNFITNLILCLLAINISLYAGKDKRKRTIDSLIIEYDARADSSSEYPPFELKQNGYIRLKIKNINLLRYSVELIEQQNNVINSTKLSENNTNINIDPNIFNLSNKELNFQTLLPVPLSNKGTLVLDRKINEKYIQQKRLKNELDSKSTRYLVEKARFDSLTLIDNTIKYLEDELNLYKDSSESKKKNSLEVELNQKRSLKRKFQINAVISKTKLNKLKSSIDTIKLNIETCEDSILILETKKKQNSSDEEAKNDIYRRFNSRLENYLNSLEELNKLSDFYQRLVSILYSDQSYKKIVSEKEALVKKLLNKEKLTSHLDDFSKIKKDDVMEILYLKLRNIETSYLEMLKSFSEVEGLKSDTNIAKTVYPKAEKVILRVTAFHSQVNIESYHSFFKQIGKVYDAINESNFTLSYETFIITDNVDRIKFTLKGTPHSDLHSSIETKPIRFEYEVSIKGGIKIDVSSGLFWNIGLNDKKYQYVNIGDTATLVEEIDSDNLYIPSFGLLFNIYRRSNSSIKFGGNVGFSTNAERVNYYAGLSILLGRSERININIGAAGAQVKTSIYKDGKILNVPITELSQEVPMQNPSPFKVGGFVGITFNFLGAKNKETLSQTNKF